MTNRLVAAVAALVPESSLVDVNKPAMPRHEVPREVQRQGLVDVDGNEVVKLTGPRESVCLQQVEKAWCSTYARPRPRCYAGRRARR